MFKFLRAFPFVRRLTPLSSLSLINQGGPVYIQRVRFINPIFTRRRIERSIFIVITSAALYRTLITVLSNDEEKEEWNAPGWKEKKSSGKVTKKATEDQQPGQGTVDPHNLLISEHMNGNQEEDEEEFEIPDTLPEDAIFIPFGFVHQRPLSFYKGTDPEWQSFVQLSRDPKRITQIRNDLARQVYHHVMGFRTFQKSLGLPIGLSKAWLDIDFPDGPPPEYERSGIEITEDYVAWTSRPISAAQYSRLLATLQPFPVLSGLWASYRLLWALQLARVKEFLDLNPNQEGSNTNGLSSFFNLRHFADASHKQDPHHPNAANEVFSQSHAKYTEEEEEEEGEEEEESINEDSSINLEEAVAPKSSKKSLAGDDIKVALRTFEQTVAKHWKQPKASAERGSLILSGLIEVVGSRGLCTLDVRAAYHLKESRWVAIGVGVRRIQLRQQYPKGGYS